MLMKCPLLKSRGARTVPKSTLSAMAPCRNAAVSMKSFSLTSLFRQLHEAFSKLAHQSVFD